MPYIQKYPLVEPLPKISRHDDLPASAVELARCVDAVSDTDPELFMLVQRDAYLSVVRSLVWRSKRGPMYLCSSYDYPLAALSWFPRALEQFRKPSSRGGLYPGAMTSGEEDVYGEMLSIESATRGYFLVNDSRQDPIGPPSEYAPTRCSLTFTLLYDLGFLEVWKSLGENFERGELSR